MLSYQGQYEMAQDLTSDGNSTNLVMLKDFLRQGQRKLNVLLDVTEIETNRTFTTVTDAITGTSYQSYKLPADFIDLTELYVTVGTTRYPATIIHDEELWQRICSASLPSSDYLEFAHIRSMGGVGSERLELYPLPASAQTATLIYRAKTPDLSADDYTTGTITTLANGAVAVTGSGSSWTSSMANRYFKVNDDGTWYKIASVGSATGLTLDSKYLGLSIAAGTSTYTIGQMPFTPDDTHILPVYFAVWHYSLFRRNIQLSREYKRMWEEGIAEAIDAHASQTESGIIVAADAVYPQSARINPNWWPKGMS